MSESILINLARRSIEEVLQAERLIDIPSLISEHPTLADHYATFINLYREDQLQESYGSLHPHKSLIEDIVYNAKFAAFEDPNSSPLSTSAYLHSSVEVMILSELQELQFSSYKDILEQITPGVHGLTIVHAQRAGTLLPLHWKELNTNERFLDRALATLELDKSTLHPDMKLYTYSVQSACDGAILNS